MEGTPRVGPQLLLRVGHLGEDMLSAYTAKGHSGPSWADAHHHLVFVFIF